jgi:hypothetical protein
MSDNSGYRAWRGGPVSWTASFAFHGWTPREKCDRGVGFSRFNGGLSPNPIQVRAEPIEIILFYGRKLRLHGLTIRDHMTVQSHQFRLSLMKSESTNQLKNMDK